jgi:hypothetical protein
MDLELREVGITEKMLLSAGLATQHYLEVAKLLDLTKSKQPPHHQNSIRKLASQTKQVAKSSSEIINESMSAHDFIVDSFSREHPNSALTLGLTMRQSVLTLSFGAIS